ncbi:MAG TPA: ADOP family duplicated permease, partial [Longimicrobiaceae bacterium]|nr:ADOP family duplicated permease [Longimicrobiaceae bacterium]
TALAQELAAAYPDTNTDWNGATVVSLHEAIVGDVDQALMIVLSVVGLILLIACANLANLLLARGTARQRELAVRTTLGAGRRRVVRQLLTESLVLALLGGVLGLALAWWSVQSVLALSAETLPRVQDVRVDARVIGFTLVLTILTGIVFGLVPALRMTHRDPQRQLRGGRGGGDGEGRRLRSGLVVAEVALAVLLLSGAGLMGRSFMELRSVDPGFVYEGVLTATMALNLTGVSPDEMADFLRERRAEILRRAEALPGVESAGTINTFPLHPGAFSVEYTPADADAAPGASGVHADTRYVSPGYLRAMGIPLLRGESLPDQLADDEPVPALLSEAAARRLWPNDDAVGRRIEVPWGESVVIGVVGDVRQIGLAQEAQPAIYFPQLIAPRLMVTLVVRTSGDPASLSGPIRQIVEQIDPSQPIRTIEPLTDLMAESIAQERFFALLFAVFGGLALALSAVGVYGVLAYAVRQRTQEIGLRIALGASAGDVLRLVAGGGMKLVALGSLIGTAGALALTRVLASELYGVTPTDPLTFALAVGFLGGIALLASYLPARRAMRLPPRTALSE